MKIFVSDSPISIILKVISLAVLTFLLCYIFVFYDENTIGFEVGVIIVLGLGFTSMLSSAYGFLVFKGGNIYVPGDFAIPYFRVQHRLKISLSEITAIEFVEEDCSSSGGRINFRYTGTPRYLRLTKKDGSYERIYLRKYCVRTWRKLKDQIIKGNKNVQVLKDIDSITGGAICETNGGRSLDGKTVIDRFFVDKDYVSDFAEKDSLYRITFVSGLVMEVSFLRSIDVSFNGRFHYSLDDQDLFDFFSDLEDGALVCIKGKKSFIRYKEDVDYDAFESVFTIFKKIK